MWEKDENNTCQLYRFFQLELFVERSESILIWEIIDKIKNDTFFPQDNFTGASAPVPVKHS